MCSAHCFKEAVHALNEYNTNDSNNTQHKHTMPKRHADSTQDENPRKRRQLSADEVFVEAARNGDTTAVRAFLEKFNPDRKKVAFDAAHEACRGNHDECLTLLLPYVETTQMDFGSLLSECVHADHVACTEVLLQHWKSVCNNVAFVPFGSQHSAGDEDDSPAMWSDPAVCRVLIDAGADVNTKAQYGTSPLHYACGAGELDVVKMLVEAGAGVRATEEGGEICLDSAAYNGHTETVRYLVGLFQVEVNHSNDESFTALHSASEHTDVVQVLIDAGADIEAMNFEDRSPLQWACITGVLDVVKVLVRAGAGVCVTDSRGCACLAQASANGCTDIVRYLLCLPEVDVNLRNDDNKTALQRAVDMNRTDIVHLLIDAGADVNTQNNEGHSPLYVACKSGELDIVKMLVRAGAGVSVADNDGYTCLMLAAWHGHTDIVRYLVGVPEVELNHQSGAAASSNTALHLAARNKRTDVVQVLIDAGADIDTQNNLGHSPLHYACKKGARDIVKMLVRAGAGVRVGDYEAAQVLIDVLHLELEAEKSRASRM